ncbi:hypothetical protein Syun_018425 [Stephania yunnanensis]|uniref:Uncharacterized protein n=1 Tax=Stephania yunnanensis TaxID=152371 RepID=A0AAP0IS74_9MAGN
MKTYVEARKGKKATSTAEYVHALRLLQNCYLHWRYANAKAEATMNVQSYTVERSFYSFLVKKSEMHDSVQRKRVEPGYLKKLAMLSSIMGAQAMTLIMNLLVSIRNKSGFPIEISENWVVLPLCLFPNMLVLLPVEGIIDVLENTVNFLME